MVEGLERGLEAPKVGDKLGMGWEFPNPKTILLNYLVKREKYRIRTKFLSYVSYFGGFTTRRVCGKRGGEREETLTGFWIFTYPPDPMCRVFLNS